MKFKVKILQNKPQVYQGLVYLGVNMDNKIKKYILKIIWSMDEDQLLHLSEEFSDLELYNLEVDGKQIRAPKEMREYLKNMEDPTLGLS